MTAEALVAATVAAGTAVVKVAVAMVAATAVAEREEAMEVGATAVVREVEG